jgi:hypothetical protein
MTLRGRKLATGSLLAALGLVVGIVLTHPHPVQRSYVYTESFQLRTDSPSAAHVAAVVRSQHVRGVRVKVFSGRNFEVSGHGSSASAAVKVVSAVQKVIDKIPHTRYNAVHGGVDAVGRGEVYPLQPAAIGLASGVAIGILIAIGQGRWSNHLQTRIWRSARRDRSTRAL